MSDVALVTSSSQNAGAASVWRESSLPQNGTYTRRQRWCVTVAYAPVVVCLPPDFVNWLKVSRGHLLPLNECFSGRISATQLSVTCNYGCAFSETPLWVIGLGIVEDITIQFTSQFFGSQFNLILICLAEDQYASVLLQLHGQMSDTPRSFITVPSSSC